MASLRIRLTRRSVLGFTSALVIFLLLFLQFTSQVPQLQDIFYTFANDSNDLSSKLHDHVNSTQSTRLMISNNHTSPQSKPAPTSPQSKPVAPTTSKRLSTEAKIQANSKQSGERAKVTLRVPKPRASHPGLSAKDEFGNPGYVTDPYKVRQHMLERIANGSEKEDGVACQAPLGEREKPRHADLLRLIKVDPSHRASNTSMPKILCVVYTYDQHHEQVTAITETWGWRCDGFFAASNLTVANSSLPGFGAIQLQHPGPEAYNNMWQKTRSIMAYLYHNYLHDFDYFYISGDDTFLIVENYRSMLLDLQSQHPNHPSKPFHIGRVMTHPLGVFTGGGAGYTLNRQALLEFGDYLLDTCLVPATAPCEDRFISECLRRRKIYPTDPMDEQNRHILQYYGPELILRDIDRAWKQSDNVTAELRLEDYISDRTATLHLYRSPAALKRLHAILYRSCPKDSPLELSLR